MHLDVEVADGLYLKELSQEEIKSWVHALTTEPALQEHHHRLSGELCIRLCDEAESQQLNREYRGRDKPTNVLSFPADIMLEEVKVLGDLLICLPVVQAEATAQNKTVAHHLHHMVVHGVLHLLGFDHEDEQQAEAMEDLERQLLSSFDIPDPYQ